MEGEEEKENNARKKGLVKKEKRYGNQERGLWEIRLSVPPEPYETPSPDWCWSL